MTSFGAGSLILVVSLLDAMRSKILVFVFLAALIPGIAHAKRKAPPKVEPVVFEGVRYVAPNDDGRRAYVQAWETSTNKMLWEVTVFRNRIRYFAEEDVQHIYISSLGIQDRKLIVVAEDNRVYSVDLKTRVVERVQEMGVDKPEANQWMQRTRR